MIIHCCFHVDQRLVDQRQVLMSRYLMRQRLVHQPTPLESLVTVSESRPYFVRMFCVHHQDLFETSTHHPATCPRLRARPVVSDVAVLACELFVSVPHEPHTYVVSSPY